MSDGGATPPATKTEHSEELLDSFTESSPEIDDTTFTQEITQVQKRKGGRKPIYATSEERKQRNRQAQAAFRERRTEYIKQLETTIKHNEEALLSAQKNHHRAADECLMLRYKNSLLERILLEKGIDVQAELQQRADYSRLPSTTPTSAGPQPSPVHSAIMSRYTQNRRSNSVHSGRPHVNQPIAPASSKVQSPRLQPTPPSQNLSPTAMTKPSVGIVQGGKSPPGGEMQAQRRQQPQLKPRPQYPQGTANLMPQPIAPNSQASPTDLRSAGGSSGSGSSYYQSPFQHHVQQLEQEYADGPPNILDDTDPGDQSFGPGPFPQQFAPPLSAPPNPPIQADLQGQPIQSMPPIQPMVQTTSSQSVGPNTPAYTHVSQPSYQNFDPEAESDPFGLSASMHFPTQYSYTESSMRR